MKYNNWKKTSNKLTLFSLQEEILEEDVPAAERKPPRRDPPGSGDDDNGNPPNTGDGANNDVPKAGNGNPEADSGNQEAGNGSTEAGNGNQEAGNGNQETGNRNPERGNENSEGAGPSYGEKSSGSGASGGASDLPDSTGGPSKMSTSSKKVSFVSFIIKLSMALLIYLKMVYASKCNIPTGARKDIWQGIAMLLSIVVPGFKESVS